MTDIAPAPAPAPAPVPPPSTMETKPPAFGPQWPGPGSVAPPAALIAAIVIALASAVMLGWDRPGVGWFATGLVAVVAVTIVAVRAGHGSGSSGDVAMRVVWAVLALALLSAGALRAAEWLWVLCLPTAMLCAALAVVGGRSVRGMLVGVVVVPIGSFLGVAWAARGMAAARGRSNSSALRIVTAAAVSLALLLIFGGLLAGADVVFARVLDSFLPDINATGVIRWIFNAIFFGLAALSACYIASRPPNFEPTGSAVERRSIGRIEWAVPVATLVLLFTGFVAVQATVLFGGANHVLETAGLTYAEYARQGFWQLLGVTLLTLVVVAVAAALASRRTVADRIWLRAVLGALAVLTLVIVASAISRMLAYQDAYGFTRLRVLVIVCEAWLGLLFVLVLLAGIRLRARWLPRVVVGSAVLALIGIVAANPDRLIAQQNLARYERTGTIDLAYLSTLSADATPVLSQLRPDLRLCVLQPIDENLDQLGPDEWFEWNLGRQQARAVLADYRPPARDAYSGPCWDVLHNSRP